MTLIKFLFQTIKFGYLYVAFIGLLASGCRNTQASTAVATAALEQPVNVSFSEEMPWSTRMAESVMKRNPESWMTDFRETPRWSYTHGLVLMAILEAGQNSDDQRYFEYVKAYADTIIDANGVIVNYDITDYNIDNINPGKIMFNLYDRTGDKRYEKVMHTLYKQLKWQPRTTEGGYWHKLRYTYQMWLDGIYMGAPFYARYAQRYGHEDDFSDIAHQFILMEKQSRNPTTGLLHHGWDESCNQRWADSLTGKSPEIWGRAVGWYAMALVDVLDYFPEDHERRPEILAILQRLVDAVVKVQDPTTGTWWQVLDKPNAPGNYLEATVSCMLTYSIIKAVNNGLIDPSYRSVAQKGFDGIIENFVEVEPSGEMHIHKCCAVAGLGGDPYRDGSYEYYVNEKIISNDTKATGPFILASLEFEKEAGKIARQ